MIDDIDTGTGAFDDPGSRGAMCPNQGAAIMCNIDRCADFFGRIIVSVRDRLAAVPIADRELDDLAATPDLLSHGLAHLMDPVHTSDESMISNVHEPGAIIAIRHIAGCQHLSRREEYAAPWSDRAESPP